MYIKKNSQTDRGDDRLTDAPTGWQNSYREVVSKLSGRTLVYIFLCPM